MNLLITPAFCGFPDEISPIHAGERGPVDDGLCVSPDVTHPSSMPDPIPLADCIAEVREQLEQMRNPERES